MQQHPYIRLEHNEALQRKRMSEKEANLLQLTRQAKLVTKQNGDLQKQAASVFQEYSFQESLCSSAGEGAMLRGLFASS